MGGKRILVWLIGSADEGGVAADSIVGCVADILLCAEGCVCGVKMLSNTLQLIMRLMARPKRQVKKHRKRVRMKASSLNCKRCMKAD